MPVASRIQRAVTPRVDRTSGTAAAWRRGPFTADLAVLALFLALVLLFGRPFAKLGIGHRALYVTEPALVLVALLALRRVGWHGAVERVRAAVPLWLLLALWAAGLLATARGLYSFGFKKTTYDVGLLEYSVMLAIIPVVIDTRERAFALLRVLAWAGLGAALVYVAQRMGNATWTDVGPALGMFIGAFVAAFAARAVHRLRTPWWSWALLLASVSAMCYVGARAVWLGLVLLIPVFVILAPSRRVLTLIVAVVVFALANVGSSVALDQVHAWLHPSTASAVVPVPLASPDYVADDKMVDVRGGVAVSGDAAQGRWAREVHEFRSLELPALNGLVSGAIYTVLFSAESQDGRSAYGRVGDASGAGWKLKPWRVGPGSHVWRPIAVTLRAKLGQERLVLLVASGDVRIDGLKVLRGRLLAPAKDYQARVAPPSTQGGTASVTARIKSAVDQAATLKDTAAAQAAADSIDHPTIFSETKGTFTSSVAGPAHENTKWRLDIWRFMFRRAVHQPFFGVGFGRPTNFRWRAGLGGLYDARTGAPSQQDVTGPHNSFVNLTFRTGLSGLLPFFALLVLAAVRTRSGLSRLRDDLEGRAALVMLVAIFVNTFVNASLSVALEGPHMGVFFWTALALLLLLPRLLARERQDSSRPAAAR